MLFSLCETCFSRGGARDFQHRHSPTRENICMGEATKTGSSLLK